MGKRHSHGVESTAAVFHHPLHPVSIAFPVAALMAAPAADLAARATGDRFWIRAGRLLLLGGLVSGVAASAVGMVDYVSIKAVRRLPSAHVHAGGNVLAMALVAVNLSRRSVDDRSAPGELDLGLSLATVALLSLTAGLAASSLTGTASGSSPMTAQRRQSTWRAWRPERADDCSRRSVRHRRHAADSNDLHVRAWMAVFEARGLPATPAAIHDQIGAPTSSSQPLLGVRKISSPRRSATNTASAELRHDMRKAAINLRQKRPRANAGGDATESACRLAGAEPT